MPFDCILRKKSNSVFPSICIDNNFRIFSFHSYLIFTKNVHAFIYLIYICSCQQWITLLIMMLQGTIFSNILCSIIESIKNSFFYRIDSSINHSDCKQIIRECSNFNFSTQINNSKVARNLLFRYNIRQRILENYSTMNQICRVVYVFYKICNYKQNRYEISQVKSKALNAMILH